MSNIPRLLLHLGLLFITACSTLANVEEVVVPVEEIAITNRHDARVLVRVRGGDPGFVSNDIFTEALVTTLDTTGVFSAVSVSEPGDYELRVVIEVAKHSVFGYSNYLNSKWDLRDSTGESVWSQEIDVEGKSMAFGGVDRVQGSAEDAAQKAIEAGVEQISELKL